MTYYSKKDKALTIWYIFFIIISIFITFAAILEYISITSAIISIIIASLPFILVAIFNSNKPNKYQIIMSIVYHKYVEDTDNFLLSVINPHYEYASQVRQAYDELYNKMTPEEWQQACKKFYKFKQEFEKINEQKAKLEELDKRIEQKSVFEDQKWLFKHHLKDKK